MLKRKFISNLLFFILYILIISILQPNPVMLENNKTNNIIKFHDSSLNNNGFNPSFNKYFEHSTNHKIKTSSHLNSNYSTISDSITPSDHSTFISRWNTSLTSTGSSNSTQVKIPLHENGSYDFFVNWGDGSSDVITSWNQSVTTHTYSSEGVYKIEINGTIKGWQFNNSGDKLKIIEISQWGDLNLGNSSSYFYGASNLMITATDAPNLVGTTTLSQTFRDGASLGKNGSLNSWDVSSVTDMSFMFSNSSFNLSISNWDVSSVTDMRYMFFNNHNFNQDISTWDVSSVNDMNTMFGFATSFDQDISNWNVSSVTDMSLMFWNAISFNQPLASWDVSSVKSMDGMFLDAKNFNQPIGNWDVSSVVNMYAMFNGIKLSINNYDNLLLGWSNLSLQQNVTFDGGNSIYSNNSAMARQHIIDTYGWEIIDGGKATVPGVPRLLSATVDEGQVKISWSPPTSNGGAPITEYRIYRSTNSSTGYSFIGTNTTSLSFVDQSVVGGTVYYYVVSSVNIFGESDFSSKVTTSVFTAPSAPKDLNATANYWGVNLSWSPPDSTGGSIITEYRIYRSTTSGNDYTFLLTKTTTLSYNDSHVDEGSTYYYTVKAVNFYGESAPSNEVSVIYAASSDSPDSDTSSDNGIFEVDFPITYLNLLFGTLFLAILNFVNKRRRPA